MSVTTCSDCYFHPNYFAEQSYCCHIPPLEACFWTRPLQRWQRRWWKPIFKRHSTSNHSYFLWHSSLFFSNYNGVISPSPLLIVIFRNFSVIPHHGRVQPLFGIAAHIGRTFPSDHIIAINHHCWSPSTMESFKCYHFWLLNFEVVLLFLITI